MKQALRPSCRLGRGRAVVGGPFLHFGKHVVLAGSTVQHTADDGHNLGAGNEVLRGKSGAVPIDPSGFDGQADVGSGSVVLRVG